MSVKPKLLVSLACAEKLNMYRDCQEGDGMIWFWKSKALSEEDLAISLAIQSLKTLRVHDGCVSISPSEVLNQPGYLESRVAAGALLHSLRREKVSVADSWENVDRIGLVAFSTAIADSLMRSRAAGIPFDEAILKLRHLSVTAS